MNERANVVESISRELLGPTEPEEDLVEAPTTRYLTGMLAPAGTQLEAVEDESLDNGQDDAESSEGDPTPTTTTMDPSSIGLSFLVEDDTNVVRCSASWGQYHANRKDGDRALWHRTPHAVDHEIPLDSTNKRSAADLSANGGIQLQWIARKVGRLKAVSVFLVNAQKPAATDRDERWLFQPQLVVRPSSVPGDPAEAELAREQTAPFVAREDIFESQDQILMSDADLQSLRLLYRDRHTFAVGHGVAADWEVALDPTRASALTTTIIPTRTVEAVVPWKGISFDMSVISEAPSAASITDMIRPMLDEYSRWIKERRAEAGSLPDAFRSTAIIHLDDCDHALDRMEAGLRKISEDRDVFQAFQFANKVMLYQRAHTVWARGFRKTGERSAGRPTYDGSWYPFQLAFILLNIVGLADPDHDDRKVGDLLWFPTGGGKTEAYLGLAGFTIGLRRLRSGRVGEKSADGVAVLMRYTLRLLTIQQFQRAAAMLCACEVVRLTDVPRWGTTPFMIGLWVGASTTPNRFEESDKALTELLADPNAEPDSGSPVQLTSCPWCGEALGISDYRADRTLEKTLVWCPREACEFSRQSRRGQPCGLPVAVVDEEIYCLCPSMVIATVDKFARMPWRGEIQSLFGQVNRRCERHGYITSAETEHRSHRATQYYPAAKVHSVEPLGPPDLVIQDELHLITGPLGTLVGLYETAIDWLSRFPSASGRGPKIVASTATIRRATEQMRRLYQRELSTFPPPGLDADKSFFAVAASPEETPGRLFMGVFGPGKSGKTAIARAYAAALASAQSAFDAFGPAADPYMTLVGYFNSLRELGGTVRLIEDDVPSWLTRIANRGGATRKIERWRELTSRIDSSDISPILDQLDLTFGGPVGTAPLDVLLATNMISVGVDITRLGLMIVAGQPKTTAEYIQATSRIGREHPGLVVCLYNWARYRDISHYERFRPYHDALYRYVEGVSVTPYASRARDRALHAVLVSMIRLGIDKMAPEDGAALIGDIAATWPSLIGPVQDRSRRIAGQGVAKETASELQSLLDEWTTSTLSGPLRYTWRSQFKQAPGPLLLRSAENADGVGLWRTLNSLRDVEPQAGVYVIGEP
jgi:hypothetical protein